MLNLNRLREARFEYQLKSAQESKKDIREKKLKIDELMKSDAGYKLATEFSKALDGILSGDLDPMTVMKDFEDKIEVAVKSGNSSPVINQIKQMLPKITDAGLIAAFKVDMEDIIKSSESVSKIPGKEGKKIVYKTVDTRTSKGLKEAEKLKADGWKISSQGFTSIQFYKYEAKEMDDEPEENHDDMENEKEKCEQDLPADKKGKTDNPDDAEQGAEPSDTIDGEDDMEEYESLLDEEEYKALQGLSKEKRIAAIKRAMADHEKTKSSPNKKPSDKKDDRPEYKNLKGYDKEKRKAILKRAIAMHKEDLKKFSEVRKPNTAFFRMLKGESYIEK